MKVFDPIHTSLKGTNLIEASAGTGKTYTIAGIFLRLILEERLTADQILVVTFTKAATEELKERIRNKLLMAKSAFLKGGSHDGFMEALVKKYDHPTWAVQRIQDAIVDFMNSGKYLAWGIVPTVKTDDIEKETVSSLSKQFRCKMESLFALGIDPAIVLRQSLITPSCGTGTLTPGNAEKVFRLTKGVSDKMRREERYA